MTLGSILVSGKEWLWPGIALLGLSIGILLWGYRRAPLPAKVRWGCLLLKFLGIAALLLCLLEPLWSGQRVQPGANFFAFLADNSQGMQIKDHQAEQSRGTQLRSLLLNDQSEWQPQLEEFFKVRRYFFDARLQPSRDFRELAFDGRSSSLVTSLKTLGERYQGQPLAGVLLFTDGNATDLPEGNPDLSGLPPVYPVVMGKDVPIRDIGVEKVTVSQTAFEDAPVTLQAQIRSNGYPNQDVIATLFDLEGNLIEEQTQRAVAEQDSLTFRFQWQPEKPGVSFYQLKVAPEDRPVSEEESEESNEATLANNTRVVVVDRGREPQRILYVGGRPNWEFKFLNRALSQDNQIHLVGLIRVAKREPKFEFRGRRGESSNPLYRGFDKKDEVTERYDQPVLVRLYTRDQKELQGGFPQSAEALYKYHAVILDDVEAGFFTQEQMSLLERFVSERGGGLLMLGGQESFRQGSFDRTPIGDMLPVYLDQSNPARPVESLSFDLTREGWLQPWTRLRRNEEAENRRLDSMPNFKVLNRLNEIKPGAQVIATATDQQGSQFPALAVQRYGYGRTAALMIGDFWRWGLGRPELQEDLTKAWRQFVRWLVADVPERIELTALPVAGDPNQAMRLEIRARDEKFHPLDNASTTLKVQFAGDPHSPRPTDDSESDTRSATEDSPAVKLQTEPSLEHAGLYHARYIPRQTGGFRAEAVVKDASGREAGRAETGWASEPPADEFRSLMPNRALLEQIARQTGGRILDISDLDGFTEQLPHEEAPITESWTFPLWHQAWVFLFALLCFLAEWGLRRWKGMA